MHQEQKTLCRACLIVCLLATAIGNTQPIDLWRHMLHPETLADTVAVEPLRFSSWDRSGGNSDLGQFYGTDSNGWNILCDVTGAGVVTEFWVTYRPLSPSSRIRIYTLSQK
jgi:hypothetical protein